MGLLKDTRNFLKDHGMKADASLDQHFAVDEGMLEAMVKKAELKKGDVVLEIGPGTGNLTRLLLKSGAKVIAVEKDRRFSSRLKKMKGDLELVFGDGLEAMKTRNFGKIVSSLPYSICEAFMENLMKVMPGMTVVTVPSGFSDILAAREGGRNFTKLSFRFRCFFSLEIVATYPKTSFYPPPRTSSALLRIIPLSNDYYGKHRNLLIMKGMLLHPGRKTGKALRESLIEERKLSGRGMTKKEAAKIVGSLRLSRKLLEKRVNDLKLKELEFLKKISPL